MIAKLEIANLAPAEHFTLGEIEELFCDPARRTDLLRWLAGDAALVVDQDTGRLLTVLYDGDMAFGRVSTLHRN